MSVRMLIVWLAGDSAVWVIGVIHTCTQVQIVKNFILMIKPKSVPHFLAHDKLFPSRSIIFSCIKICVIKLNGRFGNMTAADPDGSNTQPAIIAIFTVAYFHATRHGLAILGVGHAGDEGVFQFGRHVPIQGRSGKVSTPNRGYIIASSLDWNVSAE